MLFRDDELLLIVAKQGTPLIALDAHGHLEREFEDPRSALPFIAQGGYVGVGHKKRIRYIMPLQPEDHRVPWASNGELSATIAITGWKCQDWPKHNSQSRPPKTARGRKTWPQIARKATTGRVGAVRVIRPQTERSEA